jgi:lipoate-protein ligase B
MQADDVVMPYIKYDLGEIELPLVDAILTDLVENRQKDKIPDTLLFLSYRSCLAFGARQLDQKDFLKPLPWFVRQGIPLHKSERGGGLTFHWPGQLVCYPILKLRENERNIPQYMRNLEEIGLRTLADLGVQAHRKREKTAQIGLWVGSNKIASTGIRISRWVTSYGFALNLNGDPSPSHYIRPCGLDTDLITVAGLIGKRVDRNDVKNMVQSYFNTIMQRQEIVVKNDVPQIQDILNASRSRSTQ